MPSKGPWSVKARDHCRRKAGTRMNEPAREVGPRLARCVHRGVASRVLVMQPGCERLAALQTVAVDTIMSPSRRPSPPSRHRRSGAGRGATSWATEVVLISVSLPPSRSLSLPFSLPPPLSFSLRPSVRPSVPPSRAQQVLCVHSARCIFAPHHVSRASHPARVPPARPATRANPTASPAKPRPARSEGDNACASTSWARPPLRDAEGATAAVWPSALTNGRWSGRAKSANGGRRPQTRRQPFLLCARRLEG